MEGDESTWLESLPKQVRDRILMVTEKDFAKLISSGGLPHMIGAGGRVAIDRVVQPVVGMTAAGKPVPFVSADGKVTEESAATILTYTTSMVYAVSRARITAIAAADTNAQYFALPLIGRKVCTVAAGAFNNQSLVPALANYYGVVEIIGVITDIAGVGATLTFESPAGTPALPSVFVNTYGANVINRDLEGVVITHATLVVNQAIVVDGAGFGASTFVLILYRYWYEKP